MIRPVTDVTLVTDFSVNRPTRARAHTYECNTKKLSHPSHPSRDLGQDADELEAIQWLERHERSLNRKRREVDV